MYDIDMVVELSAVAKYKMPRIEQGHNPIRKPSRAVHGFIAYQVSYILLIVYLIWAFVPDQYLQDLGITYIPDKYWAVAIPTYVPFFILCGILFYIGLNITAVPQLNDPRTIGSDPYSYRAGEEDTQLDPGRDALPPVRDIPIEEVNTHMFQLEDVYTKRKHRK